MAWKTQAAARDGERLTDPVVVNEEVAEDELSAITATAARAAKRDKRLMNISGSDFLL